MEARHKKCYGVEQKEGGWGGCIGVGRSFRDNTRKAANYIGL